MSHMIPDEKGMARYAALLMLLTIFPLQGAESVRIEIRSSWLGWGRRQSAIIINGENSKYSANGHPVAANDVKALFLALDEPPVEKPSLENCGIDSRWLNANVDLAQRQFAPDQPELFKYTPAELVPPDTSAQQIRLFRLHFTDVTYVQQAFEDNFRHSHTDDYPEMEVEVFRDGNKVTVHSNSQHLFMLPWIVTGNQKRPDFNCHISRSIANLLPGKFTNQERFLPGKEFVFEITNEIENRTRH
jgi:hypothetical protein